MWNMNKYSMVLAFYIKIVLLRCYLSCHLLLLLLEMKVGFLTAISSTLSALADFCMQLCCPYVLIARICDAMKLWCSMAAYSTAVQVLKVKYVNWFLRHVSTTKSESCCWPTFYSSGVKCSTFCCHVFRFLLGASSYARPISHNISVIFS